MTDAGSIGAEAGALARYFAFSERRTNVRTEVLAGVTTFLTMAYIVLVNPSILGQAGMPVASVAAATCFAAGFASILMGLVANTPLALAPGMGLNAYFSFTVVQHMGVPWPVALGCVLISGVCFLILTVTGVRQLIVASIPNYLFAAVAGGIGLFIGFIGLKDAGIVVADPATYVALGHLKSPGPALAILGLILIGALSVWNVRGAMLIGIVATTIVGWLSGQVSVSPQPYSLAALTGTAFKLDLPGVLHIGNGGWSALIEILFVFLFVDLFDNIGTLVAVGKRANLFDETHRIPRLNRILLADATATICGSLAGTSTVVSYVESAAGVAAGGRTGVTAIVTGLLFVAALFVAPVVGAIPQEATAPALIVVGSLMASALAEIPWADPEAAIPAFLTMVTIPLSFSIANGLAFGFIAYAALKVLRGKFRQVNWFVYVLAALFAFRFFFVGR